MIEVTNNEFQQYVRDLINKKITHVNLAKKLKTDTRTLKDKICSLEN